MATISDASKNLTVTEGEGDININVKFEKDYTGTKISAFLIGEGGDVHEVGQSVGSTAGDTISVAVDFSVDPGRYILEIGPQDRDLPAIWPQMNQQQGTVHIRNSRYNN